MQRTPQKVTAFVTRGVGEDAELLVFRHPHAGLQLPAGTVEVDESPPAAALRTGPAPDSAQLGASLRRGLPCRLLTTVNGAAAGMVRAVPACTPRVNRQG